MRQKKEKKLHRYPYYVGLYIIGVVSVAAQVLAVLDCLEPGLVYEVEAIDSVMSTCAQVVAGLYGITLTGYIFFADRFRDTPEEDESLYDAVQALLIRYNRMAGIISLMCLVGIVGGEGIVLYGSNTILPQWLYRFWVNETLLFYYWTCNFILYFVISVLDPQKVGRISNQKKAKLSDDKTAGNTEEFLAAWADVETVLRGKWEELTRTMPFVPRAKSKPQIVHTMETLRNYGRISHGQWRKLDKLRQYYNLTLHDPTMTVSQEMCDLAKELRRELDGKK